jgi:hypothetical protein
MQQILLARNLTTTTMPQFSYGIFLAIKIAFYQAEWCEDKFK